MTLEEFEKKIDSIDVDARDDGRYTRDEIYEIGCDFIDMTPAEKRQFGGWDKLVEILKPLAKDGEIMKKGDTLKAWIKSLRYAKGEMIHDERLISGKTIDDITFEEFENQTEAIKQSLYKQQVKTRDSLNSYRRILREEARLEDFKEIMKECSKNQEDLGLIEYTGDSSKCENEAVLLISDLHIGMQVDNFYNTYNVEVARKRMGALVQKTIKYCKAHNVKRLNILELGDAVHGLIHTSARLEQEIDVVQQIMVASQILSDTVNQLRAAAPEVTYRSCTDNHSRMMPNLHESVEAEQYSKLITFYVKSKLESTNVIFPDDNLDQEIGLVELMNGDLLAFAHGHHDQYNTAFQTYCGMTQKFIKYICLAHFHSKKVKSFMGAKVIINGCVGGVDQYAFGKRLFGKPEQTLMIFDGTDMVDISLNLDIK